jgi:hypothetical protein
MHYYSTWKFKPEYDSFYRNLGLKWLDLFVLRFKVEKTRFFVVDERPNSDGVHECQVRCHVFGVSIAVFALRAHVGVDFLFAGVLEARPDASPGEQFLV